MRQILLPLAVLPFISAISSAQVITETFGTGANAFSVDFVQIGNPGNAADTTGNPNPVGSVAYIYNIGKYEVSRDMIEKANAAGGLGITLRDMTSFGGNGVNRPATGIGWYEAAKYVNWLNTSTGGTAAYKFDSSGNFQMWSAGDVGYNANNMFRNRLAKYVIASRDEWYKAAYGSPDGTWYNYPTGSDSVPIPVSGGTNTNTAVYMQFAPADIDNAGGLSAWGTMGQGGNVWEWNENTYYGNNDNAYVRELRGGSWEQSWDNSDTSFLMDSSNRHFYSNESTLEGGNGDYFLFGFRVAMIPEPSSLSLLALGGVVVALRKRKRV